MEELLTSLLLIFVIYIFYKYGEYKKIKEAHPCKIIYKIKEEKNVL
tara:strand:- start:2260 stop:2397 length:138 start_codon:yes stop_codon:yes gene_type:complete